MENQLVIDDGIITSITDQSCYTLDNVADYLYGIFDGRDDVKLEELWGALAVHPVFPSDGFKMLPEPNIRSLASALASSDKGT